MTPDTPETKVEAETVPEALAEPTRRVGAGWVVAFLLANAGLQIPLQVPSTFLMPEQIAAIDPLGKVGGYAWVSVMGAVSGIVVAPLAGALCDRTTGRFGRRRPWMVAGALICIAALLFTGLQQTVFGVAAGALLMSVGFTVLGAGLNPVVPDRVPAGQRGVVLGWAAVPQAGALIIGGVLVGMVSGIWAGYLVMAAFLALVLMFAAITKDAPLPARYREPFSLRAFLAGYRISPRTSPDFMWALITRFIMGFGYGLGTLYLPYFLSDVLHYEQLFPGQSVNDGLLIVIGVHSVSTVVLVVLGGWLSDRMGRRRGLVCAGGLTMAVAALPLALAPTWAMTLVAAVILGLGYGIYLSVDAALVTQVLPASADRGKDMALANLMGGLPYVLIPPIASAVITSAGGYTGLFLCSAVMSAVGGLLIWFIRGVR
ncbi:MFS transporter [Streptosporangium sp. NPDC000396]|uniref:MFS transporter n=1 Tax=Streptosporangium sp. NPDC000396 TaxID=3366185 RepID=UPI00368C1192